MLGRAERNYKSEILLNYLEHHFDEVSNPKRVKEVRRVLNKAYGFLEKNTAGGVRKDGSSERSHSAEVALLAAQHGFDLGVVVSALLHDLIEDHSEDRNITFSLIRRKFRLNRAEDVDMMSDPRLLVDGEGEPILDAQGNLQWIWAKDALYYKLPKTPSEYNVEKNEAKYARMNAEARPRQWILKIFDGVVNLPSLSHLDPDRQHEYKRTFVTHIFPILERFDPALRQYLIERGFLKGMPIPEYTLPMPKDKVLFFDERPEVIATRLPPAGSKSISVYSTSCQPSSAFDLEIPRKYDFELTKSIIETKLRPHAITHAPSELGPVMGRSAGHIFRVILKDKFEWRGFMRNLELFHDLYISKTPAEHAFHVSRGWRY